MNILPVIFAFLMVLAVTSFTLLKERMTTHIESKSYFAHMQATRSLRNLLEKDQYDRFIALTKEAQEKEAAAKSDPKPKSERTDKDEKDYLEKCAKRRTSTFSRLNLLFHLKKPNEKIPEVAASLLTTLYGHAPFFQEALQQNPKLSQEIVSFLLEKANDKESIPSFSLFLEEKHPSVLYKMIKGTSSYDTTTKKGYPPLEDFLSFDPTMPKAIHFQFASLPLLETLFGAKIAQELIEKEHAKWKANEGHFYLKADEIRALLANNHKESTLFTLLESEINYSNARPQVKTLRTEENDEHIQLKKTIPKLRNDD